LITAAPADNQERCDECNRPIHRAAEYRARISTTTLEPTEILALCRPCRARAIRTERQGQHDEWARAIAEEILTELLGRPVRALYLQGDEIHFTVLATKA